MNAAEAPALAELSEAARAKRCRAGACCANTLKTVALVHAAREAGVPERTSDTPAVSDKPAQTEPRPRLKRYQE